MARLLLSEGEDLVAEFRPHPATYLSQYGLSLAWISFGLLAFWLASGNAKLPDFPADALVYFAFMGLLYGGIQVWSRRREAWFSLALGATALLLALLFWWKVLPTTVPSDLYAVSLGVLGTSVLLIAHEVDRNLRQRFLTNRRLVVRGGVGRRHEHTIPLERVEAVRGVQSTFGQLFGYGTLLLVLGTKTRKKTGDMEDVEPLEGVPHYDVTKHRLEELTREVRLPTKERQRSAEERHLKESMRQLASWVRKVP